MENKDTFLRYRRNIDAVISAYKAASTEPRPANMAELQKEGEEAATWLITDFLFNVRVMAESLQTVAECFTREQEEGRAERSANNLEAHADAQTRTRQAVD